MQFRYDSNSHIRSAYFDLLFSEKNANTIEILKQASYMIQSRFNISETTIQVEEFVDDMVDCSHCQDLQD